MSLESLPVKELSEFTTNSSLSDSFTMVFLDFDDTLIPSRIYRLFASNLSIDIFELFSESKLMKLQNTIIKTVEYIRHKFKHNSQSIEFCVVSNASQTWLDYIFKGSVSHNVTSRIPVLHHYFQQNDISVISASVKSFKFLQQQFGDNANKIFINSENKENKWMWKYTTFAAIISSFQKQKHQTCEHIVSIGDGNDEKKALKQYSKTHKVQALHIKLIKAPNISQLQKQWLYLKQNTGILNKINEINNKSETDSFCVYDLRKIKELKCDNNIQLTGKTNQLPAIQHYFQSWMDNLVSMTTLMQREKVLDSVCCSIHKKMYLRDGYSEVSRTFKLILIKAICKNKQFNTFFNTYYRKIQQHAMELDRINKNKRLSVSCSS